MLSAVQAAEAIREGHLSSEKLVAQCLERIDATDSTIKAWAWIDPEHALEQARTADKIRKAGRATGALHGVPVGLKDIVDTAEVRHRLWVISDAAITDGFHEALTQCALFIVPS